MLIKTRMDSASIEVSDSNPLSMALGDICDKKELCDTEIIVGKERKMIHVVRAIIAARSKVFHSLLYQNVSSKHAPSGTNNFQHQTLERKHSQQEKLYFPEFEYDVFQVFMNYLHCGRCTITSKTVLGLMVGADMFQVYCLRHQCVQFLVDHMSNDNITYFMQDSTRFKHFPSISSVRKILYDFFRTNAEEILSTAAIGILPREIMNEVIDLPDLQATEYTKFIGAYLWTKQNYDTKNHAHISTAFTPFLNKINFALIPIRKLVENIRCTKVVPEEVLAYACAHNIQKEDFSQSHYYNSHKQSTDCISNGNYSPLMMGLEKNTHEKHDNYVLTLRRTFSGRRLKKKSTIELPLSVRTEETNLLLTQQLSKSSPCLSTCH